MFCGIYWVFQIVVRGSWAAVNPSPELEIFFLGGGGGVFFFGGGIFLLGEGNLRRSDFDDSSLIQAKAKNSFL